MAIRNMAALIPLPHITPYGEFDLDMNTRLRLAGRREFAKAAVATARKIAVLMLTLWKNETDFKWTKETTA